MKDLIVALILSLFLCSCAIQKRLFSAKAKTDTTKEIITADKAELDRISIALIDKGDEEEVDSSISNKINNVIRDLKKDLEETEKSVKAIEFFLEKKSNFNRANYNTKVDGYISQLDSFNMSRNKRDRIFELLQEAVKARAFEKYGLGAFFDPGVYKISSSSFDKIAHSFLPAIDSMAALSNRYTDIKRGIHLVIVGYADALPFSAETTLYKELKTYLKVDNPSQAQLNLALSDLRAMELMKNLKSIMKDNASKFKSFDQLTIGAVSYGRGEALPFKNITDYTENDERRRVVVFYWAILPELVNF